ERDDRITSFAPSELQAARLAVRALESETSSDEALRAHLAYMAERLLDIARARANERYELDRLRELERERDRILLQASLQEAERARREAEQLRRQAIAGAEEAERARSAERAALERSREVEQEADLARQEADQARRLAEAQTRQAELARREAEVAAAQADSLRRQLQNLQARQTDRGLVFTLGDVLFETAEADLRPESLANLERLVSFIQQYPERNVNIEGHTDSVGSAEFNLNLSQKRAEAVRDALIERGVEKSRLKAIGLGEEFPIADNQTEYGRGQNRRVEIVILKTEESSDGGG
ncbi:MAG: OmpA family protein, partial [Xanthomonadales bacterium]|nr:OmpA family protein [Xanthomonadales bacterium]